MAASWDVQGTDEKQVFAELSYVIEEWIDIFQRDNETLPDGLERTLVHRYQFKQLFDERL